ncbi:MAG: energy-coupling factor transport system ATP-binding protein [Methanofollis sp.]|nr:energy-coupling factor transport system ATP-binding protein [Methanofollis sp.]
MPVPMIRMRDLNYTYPGYNTPPVAALRSVDLDIERGEKVVVTGPSGSGKTSLLKCINGIIPHSDRNGGTFSGEVTVGGMDTRAHPVAELSRIVGTVFQNPDHQIVTNRVDAEIAFGLENRGVPPEEIETKIRRVAKLLGIEDLLERETAELSWGEKQKVAVASVLVMEPEVVVMDEPFSGLDPASSSNLARVLDSLNDAAGVTLIVAEHRVGRLAAAADRVVVMKDGAVVYDGPPVEDLATLARSRGVVLPDAAPAIAGNDLPRRSSGAGKRPAIKAIDLVFAYPGAPVRALDGVSLKIFEGEITVVLGANGSGKSTFARHLNGLLRPDAGKILLFGEEMAGIPPRTIARRVGLVSQHADHQLFEESIADEFAFGPENTGVPASEIERRIPGVLAALGLGHIDPKTPPLRLSAGEKQRVAIGSVLIMNTPIVVLDEPTLGLDEGLKRRLAETLKEMCRQRQSVVVMTHDLEFASACADRIVSMDRGKIVCDSAGGGA